MQRGNTAPNGGYVDLDRHDLAGIMGDVPIETLQVGRGYPAARRVTASPRTAAIRTRCAIRERDEGARHV